MLWSAALHSLSMSLCLFLGDSPPIPPFTEYTDQAGLTSSHQTTSEHPGESHRMMPGVGVSDFNRDGWLDLFVQAGEGYNAMLFINDGDGTFTDRAAEWGIDLTIEEGSGVAIGDMDGNGWPDIYAGTLLRCNNPLCSDDIKGGRNYLFLNLGTESFIEVGIDSGVAYVDGDPFATYGAALGDLDLDGDLDLTTIDWNIHATSGNRVFVNDGPASFNDITDTSEIYTAIARGFAPALIDLDGDHYPEFASASDWGTSHYCVNNTDMTFTQLNDNGTSTDENGMGSGFGDYDNDGDLDWFVTSIWDDDGTPEGNWGITGNRLYRNDGNHQFTDVTDIANVRNGDWGWGTSFADFNHDGLLDLIMTNGFMLSNGSNPDPTFETDPTRLWINTGNFKTGPTYLEVQNEAGLIHTTSGKGLVSFDADNDGDLDVFITANYDDHVFFRNETNPVADRWIQIELISSGSRAPDGFGATIDLTINGQTQHRAMVPGPSYLSQEPMRAHFGFEAAAIIDVIRVTWPDGAVSILTDVEPGRIITMRMADLNGDGVVRAADLAILLGNWGVCDDPCPADLNQDGLVSAQDLAQVLGEWTSE